MPGVVFQGTPFRSVGKCELGHGDDLTQLCDGRTSLREVPSCLSVKLVQALELGRRGEGERREKRKKEIQGVRGAGEENCREKRGRRGGGEKTEKFFLGSEVEGREGMKGE